MNQPSTWIDPAGQLNAQRSSNPDGFEYRGISHLALVCSDMARTVDFYSNLLDMPLVKTIELPAGMGQHFFFDIGNNDTLAFFWFPDAALPLLAVPHPNDDPIKEMRPQRLVR